MYYVTFSDDSNYTFPGIVGMDSALEFARENAMDSGWFIQNAAGELIAFSD